MFATYPCSNSVLALSVFFALLFVFFFAVFFAFSLLAHGPKNTRHLLIQGTARTMRYVHLVGTFCSISHILVIALTIFFASEYSVETMHADWRYLQMVLWCLYYISRSSRHPSGLQNQLITPPQHFERKNQYRTSSKLNKNLWSQQNQITQFW